MEIVTKTCKLCMQTKPLTAFPGNGRGKYKSTCRDCRGRMRTKHEMQRQEHGPPKQCHVCRTQKPSSEFYQFATRSGYSDKCIACAKKYAAKYRQSAPQKEPPSEKRCKTCLELKPAKDFVRHNATRDGLSDKCRRCQSRTARSSHLRRSYGITIEQFEQMAHSQSGLCAICGSKPLAMNSSDVLHVDHCHDTGVIRGLLCSACNTGIGLFSENPSTLRAAAEYLGRASIRTVP